MEFIAQSLDEIVATLGPLTVDWQDDTARRVIRRIQSLPVKGSYTVEDLKGLLDEHFDDGILMCRLFLGMSKDHFVSIFRKLVGDRGIGVNACRADSTAFLRARISLGILESMAGESNRVAHWSDRLVERLRSGRGSAISGQRRGRGVEDFVEASVRNIFGDNYHSRCEFQGPRDTAKCDFAIPSRTAPRILIEAKGYGATGSKMTDIIGDLEGIIKAKRPDTALLFFTDGLTWRQRLSDLRKIVELQNNGGVTRIYTQAMAEPFESDLRSLKEEYKL